MRFNLTSIFVMLTLVAFSNNFPKYNSIAHDWMLQENTRCNEQYRDLRVKKIKRTTTYKKGEINLRISNYDSSGYLISSEIFNEKNKLIYSYQQELSENKKLIQSISESKKGKIVNKYFYNNQQKSTRHEYWKNDKLIYYRVWVYNEKSQLIEIAAFNKKGMLNKSQHLYDENDKLIKVNYYNAKGKITRAYNFSCTNEGEKVKLAKEENLVCKLTAHENNLLVSIEETTDSKGKIKRVVRKYRDTDTLLLEENYYNVEGKLNFKTTYYEMKNKLKSRETFDNKGVAKYITQYEYDANWNITKEKCIIIGKMTSESIWNYDESGLCVKSTSKNAKNQVLYSTSYEILERY